MLRTLNTRSYEFAVSNIEFAVSSHEFTASNLRVVKKDEFFFFLLSSSILLYINEAIYYEHQIHEVTVSNYSQYRV